MKAMWKIVEKEKKAPEYEYSESYDSLEDAKKRLHVMYRETVIDGNWDLVERSSFDERSASVTFTDGNEVTWDIEELT